LAESRQALVMVMRLAGIHSDRRAACSYFITSYDVRIFSIISVLSVLVSYLALGPTRLVTDGPTRDNRPLLFSHARGHRSETNRRGAMPLSIPTQFEAYGRPIKDRCRFLG
jgi:hypothetical protein